MFQITKYLSPVALALTSLTLASAQTVPVSTDSSEARTAFDAGRERMSNADIAASLVHFNDAVAADPNFGLAHLYRAFASPPADRPEAMRRAAAADVTPGEAKLIEAYGAHMKGEYERELELLNELVREFPSDLHVAMYLANESLNQGRPEATVATLQRALEVDPEFGGAYNLLGYAAIATGDDELAESAFKNYIRVAPKDPVSSG